MTHGNFPVFYVVLSTKTHTIHTRERWITPGWRLPRGVLVNLSYWVYFICCCVFLTPGSVSLSSSGAGLLAGASSEKAKKKKKETAKKRSARGPEMCVGGARTN